MKQASTIELAQKLEKTEAAAWQDMVAAASEKYRETHNLNLDIIEGDTYISCPAIPFLHFNCVLGFGTNHLISVDYIDKVLRYFKERNLLTVYVYIVEALHQEAEQGLVDKGFIQSGRWERVWRDNKPLNEIPNSLRKGWQISKVDNITADSWASFVSGTYQIPATKNWLLDFAIRDGWYHYMLTEANKIVAVRSMFIGKDDMAFWGIEAPIPGLMTNDFSMDFALTHQMVKEGLRMKVKGFTGDIELVSDTMDTMAYSNFKSLGFSIPYRRKIYKLK